MSKKILVPLFILTISAGIALSVKKTLAQEKYGIASDQKRYLAEAEEEFDDELPKNLKAPLAVPKTEDSSAPDLVPASSPNQTAAILQTGDDNNTKIPWYIARAAGIASYALMFFIIVLGEGMTTGFAYNFVSPVRAWTIHKYLGISFGITLLAHMTSLLFDTFMNFKLSEILIPFVSGYRPVFLSLGIIGFYLVLAVIMSSLLIRLRYPAIWRNIHYLVYPLFVAGFIHGFFLGTDTPTATMRIIYGLTGLIFIFLIIHRWRFQMSRSQ